jgi:hypothetical protein
MVSTGGGNSFGSMGTVGTNGPELKIGVEPIVVPVRRLSVPAAVGEATTALRCPIDDKPSLQGKAARGAIAARGTAHGSQTGALRTRQGFRQPAKPATVSPTITNPVRFHPLISFAFRLPGSGVRRSQWRSPDAAAARLE